MKEKILFLVANYEPIRTGGERFHFEAIKSMRNAGYDVRVHSEQDLPEDKRYGFAAWRGYYDLFDETPEYEIIIAAHGMHKRQAPALRYATRKLNRKIIGFVHHLLHPLKTGSGAMVERLFERFYVRQSRHIIVNSAFTRDEVVRLNYSPDNISIVYPGLKVIEPRLAMPNNNCLQLLSSGFLEPRKGYEYLIKAVADLALDFELTIVGDETIDPAYTESLRTQINEYGLSNRINIAGYVSFEEFMRLRQNADIFVSSTLHEGFGIAALEAAAYGIPTITSNVGAIPEIFNDGKDAILVPPGNAELLRAAILKLATNEELRAKFAQTGTTIPFAKRDWEIVGDEFVEAIDKIISTL